MAHPAHRLALPVKTSLDIYEITQVLGAGGFGVTYKARDPHLNCDVAIKEYLPNDLAMRALGSTIVAKSSDTEEDFRFGLARFLEEARTLARFKHPNIVRISRYFEANGTAYLVMDYEEGRTLLEFLKEFPTPDEQQLQSIFVPILHGLEELHQAGILHRDIKPGNIYLRANGEPLLIDFGAAREALGKHSQALTGIVTAGYAPFEQYATRALLNATIDIYALGATVYRAITGFPPTEAPDRVHAVQQGDQDPLIPAVEVGAGRYSVEFLRIVDWMLAPLSKERPASVGVLLDLWDPENRDAHVSAPPLHDRPTVALDSPNRRTPRPSRRTQIHAPASSAAVKKFIWVGSGLGALVALVLGIAWMGWFPSREASPFGTVEIKSRPPGAVWSLDGNEMGKTPDRYTRVTEGVRVFEIRKYGYTTVTRKLFVRPDQAVQFDEELAFKAYKFQNSIKPDTAQLKFLTAPDSLKASLQNRVFTKNDELTLHAGTYEVEIWAPGYKRGRVHFQVDDKTVHPNLGLILNVEIDHEAVARTVELGKNIQWARVINSGKSAVFVDNANAFKIWNIETEDQISLPNTYPRDEIELGRNWAPTGSTFVTLDSDKKLIEYDWRTQKPVRRLRHEKDPYLRTVDFSVDGKTIVALMSDSSSWAATSRLYLWRAGMELPENILPLDQKAYDIVRMHPDGKTALVGISSEDGLKQISLANGALVKEYEPVHAFRDEFGRRQTNEVEFDVKASRVLYRFRKIEFINHGALFAASRQNHLYFWDAVSGRMLGHLKLKLDVKNWVFDAAQERMYIHDGERLLEWDLKTKQLLNALSVGTQVRSVSLSEEGRYVMTAGGEAKFLDLSKLKPDPQWTIKEGVTNAGAEVPARYYPAQK